MKNIHAAAILAVSVLLSGHPASAQTNGRDYIKEQISLKGSCRNVAITRTNGDLMLYDNNGWSASGCPEDLTDALQEINEKGEYINDVQLTEEGKWLIIYGSNGFRWNDIPDSLEKELRALNSEQETIASASFNDSGDWIVITENYISCSSDELDRWINDGQETNGSAWTACITEDAVFVVYEYGYKSLGNIPDTLGEALRTTEINVYRVKIAGQSWFISDGKGEYDYYM